MGSEGNDFIRVRYFSRFLWRKRSTSVGVFETCNRGYVSVHLFLEERCFSGITQSNGYIFMFCGNKMSTHDTIRLRDAINSNDLFHVHLFIDMGANVQQAVDESSYITDEMIGFLFTIGYDVQLFPRTRVSYIGEIKTQTFNGRHELEPS